MDIAGPQPRNMLQNELAIVEHLLNLLIHRMILLDDLEAPQEVLDFFEECIIIAERIWIVGNEPLTRNGLDVLLNLYRAFFPRYDRLILIDVELMDILNNN
ncbi:hypothetical protein B9Z55_025597 [Caenorhabditis nigoni]|uniref:NR LBD domain-containing protein n=1 Tax=Caenorhabditis nigoni TaxID=1611254 RepID=A0A2G5SZJ8_9PELO|nr:hypothetical protein B9Z55_025597 [Caenorhabditis nigoni]